MFIQYVKHDLVHEKPVFMNTPWADILLKH